MNKQQLTDLVIIPTLLEIPHGLSDESVTASQMIVAHESLGGEYLAQTKGPALGIIQMEPFTHDDVWRHGDSIWDNARLMGIITNLNYIMKKHPTADRLIYDLRYNVFMLRQKLFMAPGALPRDQYKMAEYLKVNWNGNGKATPDKYYQDFMDWE